MDFVQMLLNLVVPPAGFVFLLLTWPALAFISFWRWIFSYVFAEDVRGKVVVITGVSSSIGEHLAYEYGQRGAKIVLVGRRENLLKNVEERARAEGANDSLVVVADMSLEEECKKVIDGTIDKFGRIDHLVCNHGIAGSFLVEEAQSLDVFRKIMGVNLLGSIYTTYYALSHLRKSRGKIVVMASTASWLPIPRMAIYSASKAAMVNFYDTLRTELGSDLAAITIAMPGYIQSEITIGKFLAADGKFDIDVDARDTLVGPSPVLSTHYCAKEIVRAALRGQQYVVIPAWYRVSLMFRVFTPQILETFLRLFFVKELEPGKPATKVIMDAIPSAEKVVYPPGMQQKTEQKTD